MITFNREGSGVRKCIEYFHSDKYTLDLSCREVQSGGTAVPPRSILLICDIPEQGRQTPRPRTQENAVSVLYSSFFLFKQHLFM